MDQLRKLLGRRWRGAAIAGCIIVCFYLLLSHISAVWTALGSIVHYCSPAIGGCVIAYLMNPLANLYQRSLFCRVRPERARWTLSMVLAILSFLVIIAVILWLLIPQLVASVSVFVGNLGGYANTLQGWVEDLQVWLAGHGLTSTQSFDLQSFVSSSENLIDTAVDLISENTAKVISVSTSAGKGVFNWIIAFILSIYLLAAKSRLKHGARRFLKALLPEERYAACVSFLRRCHEILNRYVIFNLIDCLIVGVANGVFMGVTGMQYGGLVSVVVAITNLLPTFGPIIGAVVGTFILLMVRPVHALFFLGFTLVLQTCDGYLIKPRLFGNSLGVSGLWILIVVIVAGRVFGVVGILLAIPFAAISDHIYDAMLLPWLENRRRAKAVPAGGPEPPPPPAEPPPPPAEETPPPAEEE